MVFQSEDLWDVRGTELFVRTVGCPKCSVLLVVHGGPGANHFKHLPLSVFGSEFMVVFYDQRGTGASERLDIKADKSETLDSLSLEQNIEDIEALRCRLRKDKISIIGHSWGGALATFYATRYPECVERLIVYSGGPEDRVLCEIKEENHSKKRTDQENERIRRVIQEINTAVADGASQDMLDRLFGESLAIAYPSLYYRRPKEVPKLGRMGFWANAGAGRYIDTFNRLAFSGELRKISCPSLLIWGRHEPSPQERLLFLLDHIHGARFVIFENSGHNAMEEEASLFFETLWAFFRCEPLPQRSFGSRRELDKTEIDSI